MIGEKEEFKFYIVFKDTHDNYIEAYGYEHEPTVLDIKYVFEDMLSSDSTFKQIVPDADRVFDYVTVAIMKNKKFVKYLEEQEEKASKLEKKAEKTKKS